MKIEITVIKCGTCDQVMAAWHDSEDAHEIAAYETGHYCSEAGEYECTNCYDDRFAEGMAMAASYDREMAYQGMIRDHEEYMDSILSRADAIFDAARDRGEI